MTLTKQSEIKNINILESIKELIEVRKLIEYDYELINIVDSLIKTRLEYYTVNPTVLT